MSDSTAIVHAQQQVAQESSRSEKSRIGWDRVKSVHLRTLCLEKNQVIENG